VAIQIRNTVGDGLLVGMSDDFNDIDIERFRDLQQPTDYDRAQGHCKVRRQNGAASREVISAGLTRLPQADIEC
jgi:hypothetical protein